MLPVDDIEKQKEVAFYSASLNAWFTTQLECDKSILTLSASGIGLLITLLTTVGVTSMFACVLYTLSVISFVVSLTVVLIIYRHNAVHIENILSGNPGKDPVLSKLDMVALFSFGLGVFFAAIIGISTAIQSYTLKDISMGNNSSRKADSVMAMDSFSGMAKLQQTVTCKKSFNGAGNLQPQASSGSKETTTPAQPSPSSSGTSGTPNSGSSEQ